MKLINRKLYDKIRKMDHAEMSVFCNQIYKAGVESASPEVSAADLRQAVLGVKGIGEVKADAVVNAVLSIIKKRDKQEESEWAV